jgi:hypothetical protein
LGAKKQRYQKKDTEGAQGYLKDVSQMYQYHGARLGSTASQHRTEHGSGIGARILAVGVAS